MTDQQLTGQYNPETRQNIRQFQKQYGLPVNGQVNAETRSALAGAAGEMRYADFTRFTQFPGNTLRYGDTD